MGRHEGSYRKPQNIPTPSWAVGSQQATRPEHRPNLCMSPSCDRHWMRQKKDAIRSCTATSRPGIPSSSARHWTLHKPMFSSLSQRITNPLAAPLLSFRAYRHIDHTIITMAISGSKPFPPGIHVPCLTWFSEDQNEEIDWELQTKHIEYVISSGVHGSKFRSRCRRMRTRVG